MPDISCWSESDPKLFLNWTINGKKLIDRDYHNNFRIIKFVSILGAVSFSVLSGKIMFRDVHIITEDFTMRIQYGWIIFKWWRPYIPKTIDEGKYICSTCMSVRQTIEWTMFNPTTFLCLSQARTWISNVICSDLFCVTNLDERWLFVFVDIGGIVDHHSTLFKLSFRN
jgi:hypothetical protein